MARLGDEERDFGRWIAALSASDEADLRGQAVERVSKFAECFPPLDVRSNPVTEAAAQWPLDHPILLRARVDLVMGRPQGRESRKVIIDLKTGRVTQRHREDLRFYALVETFVRDVPPRKLATFYLDSAEPIVEDVTEGVLRTALRRTLDGIHRLIQLQIEGEAADQETGRVVPMVPVPPGMHRGPDLPTGRRRRDRTVTSRERGQLITRTSSPFCKPVPDHLTLLGQDADATG